MQFALAFSHRLLTADVFVCVRVGPLEFVVEKLSLGDIYLQVLSFSPVSIFQLLLRIHSRIMQGWTMGLLVAQFFRNML